MVALRGAASLMLSFVLTWWRLARKLARYPVNGRKRSLRDIAAELEAQGHLNERGKPFAAKSVASMLAS
jgi:hypothetical protein